MIAYLDTSVILRHVLGQEDRFQDWGRIDAFYTSEIARVESFRALDRLRLEGRFSDRDIAETSGRLREVLDEFNRIALSGLVLNRAAESFPTIVATLDAIHLASALLAVQQIKKELIFVTHDVRQGLAAQAVGFKCQGFVLPKA